MARIGVPGSPEPQLNGPAQAPVEPTALARLELLLLQLSGDDLFYGNRQDGTGFSLYPAPAKRQWMESTANRYAYRCLPLTIANQFGFWLTNPVGFTARWNGEDGRAALTLSFDKDPATWSDLISSLFGYGIVTWNMPFLFRTKPLGSQLLITGPANRFKRSAQALQAVIETDWMTSSFTMNWQLLQPHCDIRFEAGEPIMQMLPMLRDQVVDLETSDIHVRTHRDEPEMFAAYERWSKSRMEAHARQAQDGGNSWQKDYFRGRNLGEEGVVGREHHTKVRSKSIRGGERLGLDQQPLPHEDKLSAGVPATAGAAPAPAVRLFRQPGALQVRQVGESLQLDWPEDLSVVWRGGCDFELSGADALRPRVQVSTDARALCVDTGVVVEIPTGYKLRVRGVAQAASVICQVREQLLAASAPPQPVLLNLDFVRTDVPTTLRNGPLAQLELVADVARLVATAVDHTWW